MKYSFTIIPKNPEGQDFAEAIRKFCEIAATAGLVTLRFNVAEYVCLADLHEFAKSEGWAPNFARGAWSFLLRDSTLSRELGGKRHRGELLVRHRDSGRRRDVYLHHRPLDEKKELTKSANAESWEIHRESLKEVIRMLVQEPPKGPKGQGVKWCRLYEAWLQEL